jgi:glyoxylase-like metal-dependent hydrolase (beta-lactamase superfamily II)
MKPHVYPVHLAISNAFIVQHERTILVDAGQPGNARTILRRLERQGIESRDVSLILLTHGHIDHFGSAAQLKELTGAPIAIHADDADNLRAGRNPPLHPTCLLGHLMRPMLQNQQLPSLEPDLLIDESFQLDAFGVAGTIMHTPGHSAGSISLLLDGGACLAGDLMIGGILGGYVAARRPGLPYFLDDREQNVASIHRLMEQSLKQVHVGHGGPLDPDAIRRRFSV